MPLSEEEKQDIARRLNERGVVQPCPRCDTNNWFIADGYARVSLQDSPSSPYLLGGRGIPAAILVCTNCGYLSLHAAGILGIDIVGEGESAAETSTGGDGA